MPEQANGPPEPDLHVVFYDSSDDDNSHEADISIISAAEPSSYESSEVENAPAADHARPNVFGRFREALTRGVRSAYDYATGSRRPRRVPREPVSTEEESYSDNEEDDDDDDPVFGYGSSLFRDTPVPEEYGVDAEQNDVEPLEVGVDLRETILQYQRTPDDFYLNIILAALKSGVLVDAQLLEGARGSPKMMQILMESDNIDVDDEQLQLIVQAEIDRILSGDSQHGDYVAAEHADYLHALCRMEFARVNVRQMVLIRYSGFSFIRSIVDYPHLLQDAAAPKSCQIYLFRAAYIFHTIILRLGIIPTFLLSPFIISVCSYWFMSSSGEYGYWTILCYFVGFMASIITTIKAEQRRIKVYPESARWGYPDNYYVMFPIIPLYKIMLAIQSLRYDCLAENSRYFIIRHDLSNGFSIQQMTEGTYLALPQLILQLYLSFQQSKTLMMKVVIYGLICVSGLSVFCGLCSYARYATYSHSCDVFGFAILNTEEFIRKRLRVIIPILPTNIMTRLVQFFTIALTVSVFVTMLIEVVVIRHCSLLMIALVGSCLVMTLLTAVVQILIVALLNFSRLNALVTIPLLLTVVAYVVCYSIGVNRATGEDTNCTLYAQSVVPIWYYPFIIVFFATFLLFLAWLLLIVVEAIMGRRIRQESIDYCFWQTCKKEEDEKSWDE